MSDAGGGRDRSHVSVEPALEPRDPFELQLELFLRGVASGKPTPGLPTWEAAVTKQRLLQAAYRGIEDRREVAPEEINVLVGR